MEHGKRNQIFLLLCIAEVILVVWILGGNAQVVEETQDHKNTLDDCSFAKEPSKMEFYNGLDEMHVYQRPDSFLFMMHANGFDSEEVLRVQCNENREFVLLSHDYAYNVCATYETSHLNILCVGNEDLLISHFKSEHVEFLFQTLSVQSARTCTNEDIANMYKGHIII